MDWSRIPNVAMFVLLLCAFASAYRRNHTTSSKIWLLGWLMILLHYVAAMFQTLPGFCGAMGFIGQKALYILGGFLFMYAVIPNRRQASYHWLLGLLMAVSTFYIAIQRLAPEEHGMIIVAAALLGLCPLAVMLLSSRAANYRHLWAIALIYSAISIFLLKYQFQIVNTIKNYTDFDLQIVMFANYFCCLILVVYPFYRVTAGAYVTITGFFVWSVSFITTPIMILHLPQVHIENEIWDLPKFVVAIGMLLILLEDQIEHNKYIAFHDALTGLPNYRLFQDRLACALARARRTKSQTALLVIDMNRFKQVNDNYGHHVGDLLLKCVGEIFIGRVRRSDTVARTGGDEFSIILEGAVSREKAVQVSRDLAQLLSVPLQLEACTLQTSASIGIAVFPDDAEYLESLCVAADQQMYLEKHGTPLTGTIFSAPGSADSGLQMAN